MKSHTLPSRQVHLDFHTSPFIRDVGTEFNARDFAATFKAAHVNSVTVFAKCHHGHLYYNTDRPERHPGLASNLNLLGEQVEALHSQGIRAPIYISVQCDEYAANMHPEWVAVNPDGTRVGRKPLSNEGWQILDMSSPYQDYLADQTREVLKLFKPVDGLFFDMCWDQPSVSNFAKAGMAKAGLDPEADGDRQKYAHAVAIKFLKRFHKMVKDSNAKASVYFNSRPLWNLTEEAPYLSQQEIEALPTGGWGYMYFPKNVRFARNFGLEYLGMTARFHKSWADFGGYKPYAALEYETAQMLAHGAKCSIGDQLHPRGKLDDAAYELTGRIYQRVAAREPWCVNAKPVTQIGVFQTSQGNYQNVSGSDEGATRLLMQLKHQFDLINFDSPLENYELLILPDTIQLTPETVTRLQTYLKAGGALLASFLSGLNADGTQLLLPELGIKPVGLSPFTTTYIRFGKEISQNVPPADHVMYDRGVRVTSLAKSTTVARVVEPYFDRAWDHFCSHAQTPSDALSPYVAAVLKGKVAYVNCPIFSAFANHGNVPCRLLVKNLLDRLLPDPLLRVQGPTTTEATVTQQPGRMIVHLLQYSPERRTPSLDIIEDIVPIYDVPISLKMSKKPARLYVAPEKTEVPFTYTDGRVNVVVPEVAGHAMVVFES